MKKIEINPSNKPYYSEDFIKGFECGTKTQFEADNKALEQIPTRKVGKWIDGWALDASDEFEPIIRCPFCGYETAAYAWTEYDCCPKCGAYLKGEEDGNA